MFSLSMMNCGASGSSSDAQEDSQSNEESTNQSPPKLPPSTSPLLKSRTLNQKNVKGNEAVDDMIYQFVSPMTDKIFMDGTNKNL